MRPDLDGNLGSLGPLNVLTWHIHGNYLYYLAHAPHTFYLPVRPGRPAGYGGRSGAFDWPDNLVEVPIEEVPDLPLDCVLFQSAKNYLEDQYEILSPKQRELPRIYLEHDPPRQSPTDTKHPVDDPEALLVHVTAFNRMMWDNRRTPTAVIDHGVVVPDDVRYTGELERGLVIVNNLKLRGRRLGLDLFERVREEVPLDVIVMNSEEVGGLGEIPHRKLPAFSARYRFVFNPIRYTSLGLAICESLTLGIPVVGMATTEMVTAIVNGVNGYVGTDVDKVILCMRRLLEDIEEARRLSDGARSLARERFGIDRFARDWDTVIRRVCANRGALSAAA
jgi:glycosyltransferase involved in cell wall biosynthesis